MIAFLRGVLLEKHPNQVIVDTGGGGDHVQPLVGIAGAGKKPAKRIVVELKDKLDTMGMAAAASATTARPAPPLSTVEQDVLSALINLGCNRAAAEGAVRKAKSAGVAD